MAEDDQRDQAPAGSAHTQLGLGEPNRFFFHYTDREAAFTHIIPSGQLRFSPFSRVNDPLEAKLPAMEFSNSFGGGGLFEGQERLKEMTDLMNLGGDKRDPIRDRMKLLCLTVDKYEPDHVRLGYSYGAGWARARMWEQYGERSQGVCLVIDRPALTNEASAHKAEKEKIIWEEVRYTSRGLAGTDATRIAVSSDLTAEQLWEHHFLNHQDEFLFTKLRDWESEHEYRFVIEADDDEPRYISVRGSLVGVIVGHNFPAWQRAGAEHMCSEHRLLINRINWRGPHGPQLEHIDPEVQRQISLDRFSRPRP